MDARGIEGLILTTLVAEMYKAASTGIKADEDTLENARVLLRAAFKGMPNQLKKIGIEPEKDERKVF